MKEILDDMRERESRDEPMLKKKKRRMEMEVKNKNNVDPGLGRRED